MKNNNSNIIQSKTFFVELFDEAASLKLDNGDELTSIQVAHQTYGQLNNEGTNAIVVCHALTGNAHAAGTLTNEESDSSSNPDLLKKYSKMFLGKPGWWDSVIGPGKVFDTNKYFVICSNILGSCYGTTGPVSVDLKSGKPYQAYFPAVTVRDMVRVQKELMTYLGVNKIKTVVGGSLGGMQALEWVVMYPEMVESIIPIGTSAKHSAWAIGLGEVERLAIKNDPDWNNGFYAKQPIKGLSLARQIAMITYRSQPSFEEKFGREIVDEKEVFQVNSYLDYQGKKLVERFDANTYLLLADVMDRHDLGYNRDKIENVLGAIKAKTLAIGISSDILYPTEEQKFIAKNIPSAKYAEINSRHGHDAFLIEFEQLEKIIGEFLHKF
ncbi:MAG: homoserine O-acetyltransferase [bacterium]